MNLYTILIVDDEAFIVDWLSDLLEKQSNANYNIYRAYNSSHALEITKKTRIDLLITDISMPNINGLELSKQISELWPSCKCILLTAFSEFEYAVKAIQQGVSSYILKTASDNEILHEVFQAIHQIENEMNQNKLINDIQKNLKQSQTQLYRQLFFLWLQGYYSSEEELKQAKEALGFSQGTSRYCLVIGDLCNISSDGQETKNMNDVIKSFQINKIAMHYMEPYIKNIVFEIKENRIYWIIEPRTLFIDNFSSILTGALELAQKSCRETLGVATIFLIGSCVNNPSELTDLYYTGRNLMNVIDVEEEFIYVYHANELYLPDAKLKQAREEDTFRPTFFLNMKKSLESGKQDSYFASLDTACRYLEKNINWHNTVMLEIYYNIVMVIISYINERNLSTKIAFYTGTGVLFRPWLLSTWQEIASTLSEISHALFTLQSDAKKRSSIDTIQSVKDYIDTHITEDISLIDLSTLTGYSSTYLSKFFSETLGYTISDYIAKQKLSKIQELMLDASLNIGDIANAVGFHSRTYFNNYIKRLTNLSPQQYRDKVLSGSSD
jgi:two-component system response regulator YesN